MEFEAKVINELTGPMVEQIYCGMDTCIWRFKWNKPLKLFFIGKNFVKPSGESYYVTVSITPIDLNIPEESITFVIKGFFKKRISLIYRGSSRIANIVSNNNSGINETIIKSPYEKMNIMISSFKHELLGINYPRAIIVTGYTKPIVFFKPKTLFMKILNTNILLSEVLVKSLYQ
ncbi:MAG: hypothetical protein QXT88_00645 [Desulfurococcaceae archaeon]